MGRSAECDYPASVRDLPVVMSARTEDRDRPSVEIDQRVRGARARGESLYRLDVDLLRRLRPDVLLTQDLCGVCSVTEAEVVEACVQAGLRPRIVSLSPRTLEEVWNSVETVGGAIERAPAARALASKLRHRVDRGVGASRRRVAVLEWVDPPILAGLWTPAMIGLAGGVPLGPASGQPGLRTDWPGVEALRPDLLVVSPCSFSVRRTASELNGTGLGSELLRRAGPASVYLADEAYFSRPGPRLADGVELLRGLLQGAPAEHPMPVERFDARVGPVAA